MLEDLEEAFQYEVLKIESISIIDDFEIIDKILKQLNLWDVRIALYPVPGRTRHVVFFLERGHIFQVIKILAIS